MPANSFEKLIPDACGEENNFINGDIWEGVTAGGPI
jgi:hypothetical protein